MAKRLILIGLVCALGAGVAFAGDMAQFVNLGFSEDSRFFMFGQFGVLENSAAPYAECFVVDVPANAFTQRGVRKLSYTRSVEPGNNGAGALYNLIEDSIGLKRQYRIDHLLTGRLLYLLVDGAEAADTLEFRDFQTGKRYTLAVLQSASGEGKEVSSSFYVKITIEDRDGGVRHLDVGNPYFNRSGVKSYLIKQILLAPDGKSLVLIIQRAEQDTRGSNIRYMVETVRVN
jgi:predicted secreted protein